MTSVAVAGIISEMSHKTNASMKRRSRVDTSNFRLVSSIDSHCGMIS